MKKLTTQLFTVAILAYLPVAGQNATSCSNESCAVAFLSPENVTAKYKEESTSDRRDFYATKPNFDPAYEYDELYAKNATANAQKKAASGIAKIAGDNNKTPMVYYNNARVGTILKITNPGNGKSTYALVIGKIPPADRTYLLLLNDMAARRLMIKDYSTISLTYYDASVN